MNQPELGKKIADLRKSKGFTQEELVEKCNLNVRTLQRIESGEVTPRIYTLKMIFAALDYNSTDLFEISKSGFSLYPWLEQFYRYVLDLFNLKTNKMKKITILSIMFSAIIFGLFILCTESQAQEKKKPDNQVIDKNSSEQKSSNEMTFSNFSCENCFDDNGEMIGRDVKFKYNGVTINMGLIKLNKKTREFNAGFIKGKLLLNKVELTCPKDMLNDSSVNYTADKVDKSDNKILLKGNAKISSIQNDLIETDEIIITFI
jgi:transcriptional regulator with XRE-family HTH domain